MAPPLLQKSLSYAVGWLTAIAWQVYLAGSCFMSGSVIQGLIALNRPDYSYHRWHGTQLTIGVVILSAAINVLFASRLPVIGRIVLILHIGGLLATVIPLLVMAPKGSASEVLLKFQNNGGWPTTSLSTIIGMAPVVGILNGYDCIAHMCEYEI